MDADNRDRPAGADVGAGPAEDGSSAEAATIPMGVENATVRSGPPSLVDPGADEPSLTEGFESRYGLEGLLGAGGMGEVHRCLDRRIGRRVALKVARAGGGSQGQRPRFEREARIQGQLEHPSVVPVYDLGERPDGAAYFTMKRVRGLTLDEVIARLREGDSTIAEQHGQRRLLAAFGRVCLAVAFVHSRGVAHRDLKPANVILGEFGEVYVLDWGLAKPFSEVSAGEGAPGQSGAGLEDALALLDVAGRDLTEAGVILGTPGYMAPEQISRRGENVDGRADVYALGAILFELLTLEPLHEGETINDVLLSTVRGADQLPSERSPGRGIPPELDAICARAVATDRRERFQSARELGAAVEAYLEGRRDVERRTALVAGHVAEAHRLLDVAAAIGGGPEVRAEAIRAASAALALDPESAEARRAMVRAYLESADELSPEAEARLEESRSAERFRGARGAFIAFAGIALLIVPTSIWAGVSSWPALAVLLLCIGATSGAAYLMAVAKQYRKWHCLLLSALCAAVAGATVVVVGPYLLAPGIAMASVLPILFNARAEARERLVVVASCAAGLLVPAALGWAGWIPLTHLYRDGSLILVPWALRFSELETQALLLVIGVAIIVVPVVIVGRSLDALISAERRLFAQAWNLRALVPTEARDHVDEATGRSGRP